MITIYISYFDEPLSRGVPLPRKKQADITIDGLRVLLDTLQGMGFQAKCKINSKFASEFPAIPEKLRAAGQIIDVTDDMPHINYWSSLHILPPSIVAWRIENNPIILNAWEFSPKIEYNKELKLPFAIRHNAGDKLAKRMANAIDKLKNKKNGI